MPALLLQEEPHCFICFAAWMLLVTDSVKLYDSHSGSIWLFCDPDGSLSMYRRPPGAGTDFQRLTVVPPDAVARLAFCVLEERLAGQADADLLLSRLLSECGVPRLDQDLVTKALSHDA